MTARGLGFRDLVLLQVSGSYPLVLTASELFQAVSADNVGYREAIRLGRRWSSGELRARPLPPLSEVDRATSRTREGTV